MKLSRHDIAVYNNPTQPPLLSLSAIDTLQLMYTPVDVIQGDQLNMVVCFRYLLKSDLSSVDQNGTDLTVDIPVS